MPDTNAFPYPSGWCDVQSYFDNIKTIFVTKHIILNTSRSSIYISFYISSITQNQNNNPLSIPTNENPYLIISFEINDKTWNDKTLFSKMSQCGIDISSIISDSKKPGKRKEFFTLVNQLANQNLISYPEKPGFSLVGGSDMDQFPPRAYMFAGNTQSRLYSTSLTDLKIDNIYTNYLYCLNYLPNDLKDITNCSISIQTLFIIVLRYLSLLLPLSQTNTVYSLPLSFPFIISFSSYQNQNQLLTDLPHYLSFFKNPYFPAGYYDINTPFDQLRQLVNSRISNAICFDAIIDSDKVRSENINFLRDYYLSDQSDQLCCIISNTIQQMFSENEYINLEVDSVKYNPRFFPSLDYSFTLWMMLPTNGSNANTLMQFQEIATIYNEAVTKYGKSFGDPKVQKSVASLMTVYKLLVNNFLDFNDKDALELEMYHYICRLFDKRLNTEESTSIVNSFERKLQHMIESEIVTVLMHDKNNKNMPYIKTDHTLYLDNGSFIIPSEVFENICQDINIPSHKLKKALCSNGYIHMNDTLYVSKITMYPPGAPPARANAYIISSEIIEKPVIDRIKRKAFLSLSDFKQTTSPENGIDIGYDYKGNPVIWSYSKLPTAHLMITGKSGQGKTTFITKSVQLLAEKGEQVIIFDFSQSYSNNNELLPISNICTKIPLNPLNPHINEEKSSYINRIHRNLSGCFKLSQATSIKLKKLLNETYSDKIGIDADAFKENASAALTEVADFISNFYTKSSNNNTWQSILGENNITIISINDSIGDYEKTTEFLLQDFYNYKQTTDNSRVFLVVDEIQNLIRNDTNAIITILSQGRDKGIGLIMSTQSFKTIPAKYRSMFLQSGMSIYFQPEITAVDIIAKNIHADSAEKNVAEVLKKLHVGEFLAYGSMENIDGHVESDCLVFVSPVALKSDNQHNTPQLNEETTKEIPNTLISFSLKFPNIISNPVNTNGTPNLANGPTAAPSAFNYSTTSSPDGISSGSTITL
ncbi:MAG TPA: hypothetical protein PLH98_15845 [Ruminococcus flavefaciens]|nr:hypothetical protein [Ruminococcus flavefaciens]